MLKAETINKLARSRAGRIIVHLSVLAVHAQRHSLSVKNISFAWAGILREIRGV